MDVQKITALKKEMQEARSNYFCAATIVVGGTVMVVEYYPDYKERPDEVQLKFPGGKKKPERGDRTPYDTLIAEIEEEVLSDEGGRVTSWIPFHKVIKGGGHIQYFCLVVIEEGVLRQNLRFEDKEEDERGRVTRELIGVPHFVDVTRLADTIFYSHRSALKALCALFATSNIEFAQAHHALEGA